MLLIKLAAALIILLVTLLAALSTIKAHRHPHHSHFLELGDAFASGVFLGAALFHMLPESAETFHELLPAVTFPMAALFCAIGFLLLVFLERLATATTQGNHNHLTIPYIVAVVIMVHSLIEGAVLGVITDISAFAIIFIAILAHKSSDSFALSHTLVKHSITARALFILIAVFTLMTPVGILLGSSITPFMEARSGQLTTAAFSAFAAGTFLYMSTLHHINHHQRMHEAESLLEFMFLLIGVVVMAVIGLVM